MPAILADLRACLRREEQKEKIGKNKYWNQTYFARSGCFFYDISLSSNIFILSNLRSTWLSEETMHLLSTLALTIVPDASVILAGNDAFC